MDWEWTYRIKDSSIYASLLTSCDVGQSLIMSRPTQASGTARLSSWKIRHSKDVGRPEHVLQHKH